MPDTESQIKIASDGKSIVTDDIKWVMNPYDEFGVEEALRLKEKFGGEVTVVGLGPKRVTESIRTALAMGADKGILISDDGLEGSDSLATAKALAAAIKDLEYDLFLQVKEGWMMIWVWLGPPGRILGYSAVSLIVKVEVAEDGKSVKGDRPVEGETLVIESSLPVPLSLPRKGLNEPRYASLPGIMKAKKKPLEEKTLADLGLDPAEFGAGGEKSENPGVYPAPGESKQARLLKERRRRKRRRNWPNCSTKRQKSSITDDFPLTRRPVEALGMYREVRADHMEYRSRLHKQIRRR